MTEKRPRVGLFVTCLVDLFRPTVGFAAVSLLERAGCAVEVPTAQTCCGQPAYNQRRQAPTRRTSRASAIAAVRGLRLCGGAVGFVRRHDPRTLSAPIRGRAGDASRAEHLGKRTYELVSFLVDVMGMPSVDAHYAGTITYHDSCSGLRELGVKEQPRRLLRGVDRAKLDELAAPKSAAASAAPSASNIPKSPSAWPPTRPPTSPRPAPTRCWPAIWAACSIWPGGWRAKAARCKCRHVAEVLAGMTDAAPPIAAAERPKAELMDAPRSAPARASRPTAPPPWPIRSCARPSARCGPASRPIARRPR